MYLSGTIPCSLCTLSCFHWGSSGILHLQYTGTACVFFTEEVFVLRFLMTGNICIFPLSRHCCRCLRILDWSKRKSSGFTPKASAVANAIANSPQSLEPD